MKKRKILSLFLSLCLLISLLPTVALAADQVAGESGARITEADYDSTNNILTINVDIKIPNSSGIKTVGSIISYDSSKLTLIDGDGDIYTPASPAIDADPAIQVKLIDTAKKAYSTDSGVKLYGDTSRAGLFVGLGSTKGPSNKQKTTDWLTIYQLRFKVSGNAADILNSDSLRIADPAVDNDVIKGAYLANNKFVISVDSGDSIGYKYGKMKGYTGGDVGGANWVMNPANVTATYPGSTNSPSATTYTVSFDANGGTGTMADVTGVTGSYTLPANGFTAPSGKQFKGWATSASGTVITGTSITVSADTKLYAIWEPIPVTTYTVSFDANGGTGTMADVTGVTGSYTLPANGFTAPSGKQFKGWATSASGTVITGTSITVSADTKLYAIWEPIPVTTYTVSFDANGGTGTMADVTGVTGSYTLPANGFTAPSGKQFKGWATSASGAVITGTSITVSADTTLYAIWEPIPVTEYTITFNVNGGIGTIPSQTTSGQKLSSLPTATHSGSYSFVGWYTAASGGTQITTAYVFSANTTVYAHWTYTGGSVGVGSYTPSYTVSVDKTENGTITVSPKSASKGSIVTITVKPDKGYTLETLRALDMSGYAMELTENNGRFTFKMPASAVIVKATFMDDNTMLNFFVDVKASDYFYDAVLWAAEKGVTSGADALHFSPNAPCTRAQIVTFLWRAAGSPAPKNMSSFADVPADAFYAKAVAWAVENGITGGTGDGKFSPDATCTRAQAVTFLYRASGAPAVSGNAAFSDVATNAYYAAAVKWAEKNGITGGIGGGLFGSNNNCTRAQIVTFLYRSVK